MGAEQVVLHLVAARVGSGRLPPADKRNQRRETNRLPLDLQTPRLAAQQPARVADQALDPEAVKVVDQMVGPVVAAGVTFRTCLNAYR